MFRLYCNNINLCAFTQYPECPDMSYNTTMSYTLELVAHRLRIVDSPLSCPERNSVCPTVEPGEGNALQTSAGSL